MCSSFFLWYKGSPSDNNGEVIFNIKRAANSQVWEIYPASPLYFFAILNRNSNHTANATASPGKGFFMLKAPKKAKVATTHVMKNKITLLISAIV